MQASFSRLALVELTGIEPMTPRMPCSWVPSCSGQGTQRHGRERWNPLQTGCVRVTVLAGGIAVNQPCEEVML